MANGSLPAGFVLDEPGKSTSSTPAMLPSGFVLDAVTPETSVTPQLITRGMRRQQELARQDVEQDILEGVETGRLTAKDLTPEQREKVQQARRDRLPELTGILSGEDKLKVAAIAPALLSTFDPDETIDILQKNFPNIDVVKAGPEDNAPITLVNRDTQAVAQVARKGEFTGNDALKLIGVSSAFIPGASLAARAGGGLLVRGAAQAGTAGVTEGILQAGQKAVGGEFDEAEVALAGAFGFAGEAAGSFISTMRRLARSGLRTNEAARRAAIQSGASDDALRAFDERLEVVARGEQVGVPVGTTDIIPPETATGKLAQQAAEKIPLVGTGKVRAAQQRAREATLEDLASNAGVDLESDLERQIVRGLSDKQKQRHARAVQLRNGATSALSEQGDFTANNAIKRIDTIISNERKLRERANTGLIGELEDLKSSLQPGGDFELTGRLRTTLIQDIKRLQKGEHAVLSSQEEATLQSVKTALDRDMLSFARKTDKKAAQDWVKSNRLFAEEFTKFKQSELKRLLAKGELTPEVVLPVIRGGKESELRRLNKNITSAGRANVRGVIVRDLLQSAGFPDNINPDKFATEIKKPKNRKAINVFFTESDRKQIVGLGKLLDATRRAQQAEVVTPTGQQTIPFIVGATLNIGSLLGGASIGVAGRMYDSRPVRNMLVRMATLPKG
ncbi:MAG: hypothetical protein EP297_00110, partial [Gammaproteobacteria bacterium]